jgi:hypothetical protein
MLETVQHKAVFDADTGRILWLCDMVNDPQEREDLADSARGKDIGDALKQRLADLLMQLRPATVLF